MAVEVCFHPHTFEEFFQPVDIRHPGLCELLRSEFWRYVASDRAELPSIFGRDVAYTQPAAAFDACMMHIHIRIPPARFPQGRPQNDRVCAKGMPGDDAALVYVPGELYEDRYLLFAFLWPDAYGKARDGETMLFLARLAKQWRDMN